MVYLKIDLTNKQCENFKVINRNIEKKVKMFGGIVNVNVVKCLQQQLLILIEALLNLAVV